MKPSRTFTLAATALFLLGLELVALVLVAYLAPEALPSLAEPAATLALAISAAGGVGSAAMGLRDFGSKGRTSSQWGAVTRSRVTEAKARRGELGAPQGGPGDAPEDV